MHICRALTRKRLFPGDNYLAQISLICGVLGTPTGDLDYIQKPEAVAYLKAMPQVQPRPWREFLKTDDEETIDFIEKMLQFNPAKRATAEELMKHPYLKVLHDPDDEPSAERPFVWEGDASSLDECRERFWNLAHEFSDQTAHQQKSSAS